MNVSSRVAGSIDCSIAWRYHSEFLISSGTPLTAGRDCKTCFYLLFRTVAEMSLRYPSKNVKLPFNAPNLSSSNSKDEGGFLSTKRTYTTSQIEQTICGMSVSDSDSGIWLLGCHETDLVVLILLRCGKNKSKYVCPRCNIFYCSLDCFRDEVSERPDASMQSIDPLRRNISSVPNHSTLPQSVKPSKRTAPPLPTRNAR
jgi:hypothetical protein